MDKNEYPLRKEFPSKHVAERFLESLDFRFSHEYSDTYVYKSKFSPPRTATLSQEANSMGWVLHVVIDQPETGEGWC